MKAQTLRNIWIIGFYVVSCILLAVLSGDIAWVRAF